MQTGQSETEQTIKQITSTLAVGDHKIKCPLCQNEKIGYYENKNFSQKYDLPNKNHQCVNLESFNNYFSAFYGQIKILYNFLGL